MYRALRFALCVFLSAGCTLPVRAEPSATASPSPPLTPRATRTPLATFLATAADLSGLFVLPVEGITPPSDPAFYPEAERSYRGGRHEGVDFPAAAGTPVRSAAEGIVMRVDRDFVDWSREERDAALEAARLQGFTSPATLDRIRGRQVWIDHGHGVVTRYAHLASVAELRVGFSVPAGLTIGAVGSSGYPEGGPHLHFEIRFAEHYLGQGTGPEQSMSAVLRAFREQEIRPSRPPETPASSR